MLTNHPKMQTPRLELVRLTENHIAGFHTVWSDPVATRWSPHGVCKTMEDSREWMSGLLLDKNPVGENYAVLLRKDMDSDTIIKQLKAGQGDAENDNHSEVLVNGGFIGVVGTWRSDPVPELGYIFHQSTWGLGFATEALQAFGELFWTCKPQFDVLDAYCDTENEASINVLRKCGFELVEVTKGDYVLPLMIPSTRDSMHFRLTRPVST